jgi:hypothetical protein
MGPAPTEKLTKYKQIIRIGSQPRPTTLASSCSLRKNIKVN